MRPSKFTPAEREHYARLACHRSVVDVAKMLGVHTTTIMLWKRAHDLTVPWEERRVTGVPRIDRNEKQLRAMMDRVYALLQEQRYLLK